MQKIIVTGGSGFMGTNVVESLIKDGYVILNIDIAQPVKENHLQYWKPINILDYQKLETAIIAFNPEIIIHLAAVTDLNGTDLDYYLVNTVGTKNVIEVASKISGLKKVIYTSSMLVCKLGFIPNDYNTYNPHTVYGESKVKGELLVKEIQNSNYDWLIIRPTSIWGPWFKAPYIDFFKIVYFKKFFRFKNACNKTYGYIENTVFQIKSLINADNVHGKTFYLGDVPATNISEWANEISFEMGKGEIKNIPYSFVKALAILGDILKKFKIKFPMSSFRLLNMTTNNVLPLKDLNDIVGTPPYSRLEGTKKTVRWMKENKIIS